MMQKKFANQFKFRVVFNTKQDSCDLLQIVKPYTKQDNSPVRPVIFIHGMTGRLKSFTRTNKCQNTVF